MFMIKKGIKKKISLLLMMVLVVTVAFSACVIGDTSKEKDTTKNGSPSEQKEIPLDKISFFYITSGLTVPENFDTKNNFVLDEIAKLANVEIEEAVVPSYPADYVTKFHLMIASGDMCDVIHMPLVNDLNNYGKNGTFVELTDIINNSFIMEKRYSPYYELLKADDGKIYCLRSLPVDGDGNSFAVRYDLLEEIGYTNIPETMDEWIDAMRKLKAKYPDSIPYTSRENLHFSEFVFQSYGCSSNGIGWQYYKGEVIHTFENPLYKEALKVYQLMLAEDLMDKEFVTSNAQDFQDKRLNRNVLINQQNLTAIATWVERFPKNNIPNVMFVPSQFPKVDDPRIDPINVYGGPASLGGHGVAISSTSKKKDASVRFLEALLSDECKELTVWGREGIEFDVVNGQIVPNYEKASETNWRLMYNMLFGFNTRGILELFAKSNIASSGLDDADKQKYEKIFLEQADKVLADINSVPMNPMNFIILDTETTTRSTEASTEALSIAVKAIIGEISMDEFDTLAQNYVKKYQYVTDEYNQKLPEAKTKIK